MIDTNPNESAGLWLGKTDDLWQWGKPQGWGSVWLDEVRRASGTKIGRVTSGTEIERVPVF